MLAINYDGTNKISFSGTEYINPNHGTCRLAMNNGDTCDKYGLTTNVSATDYHSPSINVGNSIAYIGKYCDYGSYSCCNSNYVFPSCLDKVYTYSSTDSNSLNVTTYRYWKVCATQYCETLSEMILNGLCACKTETTSSGYNNATENPSDWVCSASWKSSRSRLIYDLTRYCCTLSDKYFYGTYSFYKTSSHDVSYTKESCCNYLYQSENVQTKAYYKYCLTDYEESRSVKCTTRARETCSFTTCSTSQSNCTISWYEVAPNISWQEVHNYTNSYYETRELGYISPTYKYSTTMTSANCNIAYVCGAIGQVNVNSSTRNITKYCLTKYNCTCTTLSGCITPDGFNMLCSLSTNTEKITNTLCVCNNYTCERRHTYCISAFCTYSSKQLGCGLLASCSTFCPSCVSQCNMQINGVVGGCYTATCNFTNVTKTACAWFTSCKPYAYSTTMNYTASAVGKSETPLVQVNSTYCTSYYCYLCLTKSYPIWQRFDGGGCVTSFTSTNTYTYSCSNAWGKGTTYYITDNVCSCATCSVYESYFGSLYGSICLWATLTARSSQNVGQYNCSYSHYVWATVCFSGCCVWANTGTFSKSTSGVNSENISSSVVNCFMKNKITIHLSNYVGMSNGVATPHYTVTYWGINNVCNYYGKKCYFNTCFGSNVISTNSAWTRYGIRVTGSIFTYVSGSVVTNSSYSGSYSTGSFASWCSKSYCGTISRCTYSGNYYGSVYCGADSYRDVTCTSYLSKSNYSGSYCTGLSVTCCSICSSCYNVTYCCITGICECVLVSSCYTGSVCSKADTKSCYTASSYYSGTIYESRDTKSCYIQKASYYGQETCSRFTRSHNFNI